MRTFNLTALKPAAKTTKDKPSGDAEEFETNDGFQISNRGLFHKNPNRCARNVESDKSAVEPVPMAPDAIEDALKLIEEEDQSICLSEKLQSGSHHPI